MSLLFKAASLADRLGLRRLVAKGASRAYPGRSFEVDQDGRWINRQAEATFVSPNLSLATFAAAEEWVLDNWTWGYLPKAGDTVIDVGGGIGEEAVVFSRLVGETGRVVSIEAHPGTFACLKRTIELSGLTNVVPLWCAVADREGELFISDVELLSNSVIGSTSGIKVRARTLDSIAAEMGIKDVALLKMNIEGAEKLAVRGMSQLAPRIQNAVISCHDFLISHFGAGPEFAVKREVRQVLEDQGFTIETRPDADQPWTRDYLYASR